MENWKKIVLKAAGVGVGFAVAAGIIVGVALWWSSRPVKLKPWNTKAIAAAFDTLDTEGEKNTIEFIYTLENNTDYDYRVGSENDIHLAATLKNERSLSFSAPDFLKADYPIFIPARGRVRFTLHIAYPYPTREDMDASDDVRHDYRTKLAQFADKEFGNLGGFALLDDNSRYQVNMPNGWTQRAKESLRVKGPDIPK